MQTRGKSNFILAVVVIYNIDLIDSITLNTLNSVKEFYEEVIEIVVIDNSEKQSKILNNPQNYRYIFNGNKSKLAGAYNLALTLANDLEKDWLLLLDQDTELTKEYFISLTTFMNSSYNSEINAVVPFLWSENKLISPQKLLFNNWIKKRTLIAEKSSDLVVALNSMSLLKVEFLNSINGFNQLYTLDMLDYWLYFQLYKKHKKVHILNCDINHNLSVNTYEKSITIERHKDLLIAEKKISKELGQIYFFVYKLRLIIRFFKQFFWIHDKRYSVLTLKSFIGLL